MGTRGEIIVKMESRLYLVLVALLALATSIPSFASQTTNSDNPFWQSVPFPYKASVWCVLVDSLGTMFAGTADSGIYRSSDNGETWAWITNGGNGNAGELTITSSIACDPHGNLFASLHGQVYKSTDDGLTWNKLNIGSDVTYVRTIVANSEGQVFAGGVGGISRSTDGGTIWSTVFFDETQVYAMTFNSIGDIYASGGGCEIFRSTDDGTSWCHVTFVGRSPWLYTTRAIAIGADNVIYLGTDGGVMKSNDLGAFWYWSDSGLPEVYMSDLKENSIGHLFAATADGVYLSLHNAASWIQLNSGLEGIEVLCFATNKAGDLLAGTFEHGIFKTRQSTTMFGINQRIVRIVSDITSSPVRDTIVIRNRGVDTLLISKVNSTNPAFNITPSSATISPGDTGCFQVSTMATSAGKYSGNIVFTSNSYLSPDSIPVLLYSKVPFLKLQESGVLCGNVLTGECKDTSLLLENVGFDTLRIISVSSTDPQFSVVQIPSLVLPRRSDSLVIRFTPATPDVYSKQAMITIVSNSAESPDSVGASGIGLAPVGIKQPKGKPIEFQLGQNYPNPFNPTTTLSYQLPTNSFVSLKIYDVLGREVKSLVNEKQNAGGHSVTFDGSNFPSGVYFYRIQAGSQIQTKKLTLLK